VTSAGIVTEPDDVIVWRSCNPNGATKDVCENGV
jgi:hypothetical protein